jgi:hypothetical protein
MENLHALWFYTAVWKKTDTSKRRTARSPAAEMLPEYAPQAFATRLVTVNRDRQGKPYLANRRPASDDWNATRSAGASSWPGYLIPTEARAETFIGCALVRGLRSK